MLAESEHAVESNSRVVSSALIDGDAVDDVAFAQVFEGPEEMLRGDAKHGCPNANAGIERDDSVAFEFLAKPVDKSNLPSSGPPGARGRQLNIFDDACGP